jgi:hypothetical protein
VLRVVLDEAHQILTDTGFRPQFQKLCELAEFKVQRIYLTASLPKRLEAQFLTQACLPPDTVIIRAPSDQPQIGYIKLTYNTMNTNNIRLAVDVASIMTEVIGPKRKGILFCSSIDEADELGSRFTEKCVSHSKLPTDIKGHNEAKWKAGHSQWIAATTGMVCGIDDPNVGAVIFVGIGYGLVNLYQGAGRSGRNGTCSWAIVLQSSNTSVAIPATGFSDDPKCIQESHNWLHSNECRRIGFSSLFDKANVSCFDLPSAHFCDFCKPDSELIARLRSKIVDPPVQRQDKDNYDAIDSQLMSMDFEGIPELSGPVSVSSYPFHFAPTPGEPSMKIQRQVAFYHATLSTKEAKSMALNAFTTKLLGKCPLCWAYQGILVPRHKERMWIQCRGPLGHGYMQFGLDRPFKKQIKFPPYKFCWKCHLPQDNFKPPSHPNFGTGSKALKECPHEDFVVLLVIFIRQVPEWWERACEAFGLASNMGEPELVKWYTAEEVQGGFNNSLELILWFYVEKEKERGGGVTIT